MLAGVEVEFGFGVGFNAVFGEMGEKRFEVELEVELVALELEWMGRGEQAGNERVC